MAVATEAQSQLILPNGFINKPIQGDLYRAHGKLGNQDAAGKCLGRGVLWIPEPEFEVLPRQTTNLRGQHPEPLTETSFRRGNHPVALPSARDFPPAIGR